MMVTKTQREQLKSILAESNKYDPNTLQISKDGSVSAKHDADKTFAGPNPMRFLVGHYEDILSSRVA